MDPDKARDQATQKEVNDQFSKEQDKAAIAGYDKYRTFIDSAEWTEATMVK